MDADDSVNEWSSDIESDRQPSDDSSLNIQPARGARLPQSQRRPANRTLSFVPYADWSPDQAYDDLPPSCMHYFMEWKLTVNRRIIAKQTENDLVVAPSDFWTEELFSKIADIVKSTGKSCEADATTIAICVNDRSEHDITKRFTKLDIDWLVIERQLQTWSHLLRIGKKLRINVSFNYTESNKASRTAGRGATAAALAERNTRLDTEQAVSGGPDAWRQVYSLMRCPGPPCDLGPYCWQDLETHKHYKLLGHILRTLVKFVQRGGKLESHDDVPPDVRTQLYAEQQQHQNRKRKRRDSGSSPTGQPPMIINNYIPSCPSLSGSAPPDSAPNLSLQSCPLNIPGLRDEAVKAYCEWHCSKVGCLIQRQHYELARNLTLDRGDDLELVYEDKNSQLYIELGVLDGVARRWVRDVKTFLEEYDIIYHR